jgi:hypothetical protein
MVRRASCVASGDGMGWAWCLYGARQRAACLTLIGRDARRRSHACVPRFQVSSLIGTKINEYDLKLDPRAGGRRLVRCAVVLL